MHNYPFGHTVVSLGDSSFMSCITVWPHSSKFGRLFHFEQKAPKRLHVTQPTYIALGIESCSQPM